MLCLFHRYLVRRAIIHQMFTDIYASWTINARDSKGQSCDRWCLSWSLWCKYFPSLLIAATLLLIMKAVKCRFPPKHSRSTLHWPEISKKYSPQLLLKVLFIMISSRTSWLPAAKTGWRRSALYAALHTETKSLYTLKTFANLTFKVPNARKWIRHGLKKELFPNVAAAVRTRSQLEDRLKVLPKYYGIEYEWPYLWLNFIFDYLRVRIVAD